ncbi:MAG: PrsW family glutamic-type intramembrane protease [Bacteroidota bacterium]
MLTAQQIYLIFPILGSICGAMLWLNYFKRIDLLEGERTRDVIVAFVIGFLTPSLTLWIYYGFGLLDFKINGDFTNDFIYSLFGVGMAEELSKLLGVFIAFKFLKKRINEPIDYLVFAGIVALGFSVRENFIYYHNYGSQIITGRSFISCLVHIINTSICVYGIYRSEVFNKGNKYLNAFSGVGIAILSHGLFDFFLTQSFLGDFTPLLSSLIYLIGINFWMQMINNSINFSPFFSYEKIGSTTKLYSTIFIWYLIIVIVEFIYAYYYKDWIFALTEISKNILQEGFLLIIVALRTSRLRINKGKYLKVRLQLPFHFTKNDDEDILFLGLPIKIRGENEKEFRFLQFLGKEILICPVDEQQTLKKERRARVIKKYFLKNDVVTYLVEIFDEDGTKGNMFILKPKTTKFTDLKHKYPVAILMDNERLTSQSETEHPSYDELKKIELVYIKLREK